MTSYDRYQQQLYENWLVEIILDIINFLLQLSPSVLAGPSAPNNPPRPLPPNTHTFNFFLSESITRQFVHPLLQKITLHLFILNWLYYHLLECIMCPGLLSWTALCFHDNVY